ncbi:hypothetical protein KI387_022195, partial [Taxus chinensis]
MHEVMDTTDKKACVYHDPVKTKKVNIGTDVEPKEAIIGDYWSEKEVANIIELLHEFQDLFPQGYKKLKRVHPSL